MRKTYKPLTKSENARVVIDSAPPIYLAQLNKEKIDARELRVSGTSAGMMPMGTALVPTIRFDPDARADYVTLQACHEDPTSACYNTNTFVNRAIIPAFSEGTVFLGVQACLSPDRALNPQVLCGPPDKIEFRQPPNYNTKIANMLDQRSRLMEEAAGLGRRWKQILSDLQPKLDQCIENHKETVSLRAKRGLVVLGLGFAEQIVGMMLMVGVPAAMSISMMRDSRKTLKPGQGIAGASDDIIGYGSNSSGQVNKVTLASTSRLDSNGSSIRKFTARELDEIEKSNKSIIDNLEYVNKQNAKESKKSIVSDATISGIDVIRSQAQGILYNEERKKEETHRRSNPLAVKSKTGKNQGTTNQGDSNGVVGLGLTESLQEQKVAEAERINRYKEEKANERYQQYDPLKTNPYAATAANMANHNKTMYNVMNLQVLHSTQQSAMMFNTGYESGGVTAIGAALFDLAFTDTLVQNPCLADKTASFELDKIKLRLNSITSEMNELVTQIELSGHIQNQKYIEMMNEVNEFNGEKTP